LEMLCHELIFSSRQLHFLHGVDPIPGDSWPTEATTCAAYIAEVTGNQNVHRLLSEGEEPRIMNLRCRFRLHENFPLKVDVAECPIERDYVAKCELSMQELLCKPEANIRRKKMPIKTPDSVTPLHFDMMQQLEQSWKLHQEDKVHELKLTPAASNVELYQARYLEVAAKRQLVFEYLQQALCTFPTGYGGRHACGFRLLKSANTHPTASMLDYAKIGGGEPEIIFSFNPFLSADSQHKVVDAAQSLLQLCVLEDKFTRLIYFSFRHQTAKLLQEIQVRRIWDVQQHPEWLLFEMEGGLQIRPIQYTVAKHIIDNPGSILQLNMGEGKTRVIVPMLALHWGDQKTLVRCHTLSTLLDEMTEFLHINLSGSILRRKVYIMPFTRDVKLSLDRVAVMQSSMAQCMMDRGLLLVAPEHRLSLHLKSLELHAKGENAICAALTKLASLPVQELYDESDEILRHKYQLIYAMGTPVALPDGEARWYAAQAVFRAIKHSPAARQLISDLNVSTQQVRRAERFPCIRLIPGEALDGIVEDLYATLGWCILEDPPYELKELGGLHKNKNHMQRCHTFVADSSSSINELPVKVREWESRTFLLALRGFLACGVMVHCLKKRHRVDYGVNESGKKRLAVPFRACDTPSERSEYGHPDMAIGLTILAYYYRGLTPDAVKNAFKLLLECGPAAQKDIYNSWFELSRPEMDTDQIESLDDVRKVDLSNEHQLLSLVEFYQFNMETINFWLNHCVFPSETTQFPQKIIGNAWHLADNRQGRANGFSGTNENHLVLPLQVKQNMQIKQLAATNGKMLELILDHPTYISISQVAWESVLNVAIDSSVDALIDCGALTAGASNVDIAAYLLERIPLGSFKGVIFFDSSQQAWCILDYRGQMPMAQSPIREHECFAFFDEARSRGSDLKLKENAVALLTLGPAITKDKLMQGAGRMRLLGRGQSIKICGYTEVTQKIKALQIARSNGSRSKKVSIKALMEWVLQNTAKATEDALPEWADQGMIFATCGTNPDDAFFDDVFTLQSFYSSAMHTKSATTVMHDSVETHMSRVHGTMSPEQSELKEGIIKFASEYGQEIQVIASALDEEYERELEREVEKEKEIEREISCQEPAQEKDWDSSMVFAAKSSAQLPITTCSLSDLLDTTYQLKGLTINWPDTLKCTSNFARTINSLDNTDDYLPLVDAVLIFWSSKVAKQKRSISELVLLSSREADRLLLKFWQHTGSLEQRRVSFVNFSCIKSCSAVPQMILNYPQNAECIDSCHHSSVAIQTFSGDTAYAEDAYDRVSEFLRHLCSTPGQSAMVARHLVQMRGHGNSYVRSDLDKILSNLVAV